MLIRLLVVCELLVIVAWIYLLFQWHPDAIAVEPFSVPQANVRYAALRTDISRQLQVANEQPTALALSDDSNSDFGLDNVFDRAETNVPEPVPTPFSFGTINDRPLIHTPENAADARHNTHNATGPERNVRSTIAAPTSAVTPAPAAIPPAPPPACPYRLSTIIHGTGRSTVVLVNTATNESLFLTTGQKAGDWLVTDIGSDTITINSGHSEKTLWIE